MSFKFHTINVYCQGFCSNGIIADTRIPYLQVLIYTMAETISIYHLQIVLSKSFNIYIFFGKLLTCFNDGSQNYAST